MSGTWSKAGARLGSRIPTFRSPVHETLGKFGLLYEIVHRFDHLIVASDHGGRAAVMPTDPNVAVRQTENDLKTLIVGHSGTSSPEGPTQS
jgi:hypothetical protein